MAKCDCGRELERCEDSDGVWFECPKHGEIKGVLDEGGNTG
jgi:hypothetical protein